MGFRAFDHTPAQARIGEGALGVAPANRHLDLDAEGGLYRHDVFLELIGQVEAYRVRPGTHAVADEAFKRHARVRAVELPEGVFSVGREAFRGNRQLVRVDLPESLERIGERAFLDTSIGTLRLAAGVREIGEDALLVQGDNQLMPRTPLRIGLARCGQPRVLPGERASVPARRQRRWAATRAFCTWGPTRWCAYRAR